MPLHDGELLGRELQGAVQDVDGGPGLADVVQGGGQHGPGHVAARKSQAVHERRNEAVHQHAVLEGAVVMAADAFDPVRHAGPPDVLKQLGVGLLDLRHGGDRAA